MHKKTVPVVKAYTFPITYGSSVFFVYYSESAGGWQARVAAAIP
jgi:hypothetical protein